MTIRELFQSLATRPDADIPVLSLYLDRRPQESGENPAIRESDIVVKDRLHEIEKSFLPRGETLDMIRNQSSRIEAYLADEADPAAQGIAIFAGDGLFETLEVGVPFETQVSLGPRPDLFQFARLLDEQETAVVAVVDTNTARLFVWRAGWLDEVPGPNDKNTKMYRKRQMGGWSQKRYQRRIDNNREAFAAQSATAIEELVDKEQAKRLILAGDEVAITPLKAALPERINELVEDTLRLDIRTPQSDIRDEIEPILAEAEAESSRSLVEQLVGAVRSDGLGVSGVGPTRKALANGQVETVLIDPQSTFDEETRNDLVLLAANSGADVVIVDDDDTFRSMGGVGGLLRYRI